MPLPGGGVGDLVQQCREERVRVEVVVDRDSMHGPPAAGRPVITELRAAGAGEPHDARLPCEQTFYVRLRAGRQEGTQRRGRLR
jgi:hypothetical protein